MRDDAMPPLRPAAASQAPGGGGLVVYGLLAVLIFTWGGNYTWMKLAMADMGPWTFHALRYAGAVAVTAGLLGAAGGARGLMPAPGEWATISLIGLLQVGVLSAAITLALLYIEASRTVLVVYTNPVWTMLLSILLLGERTTWNRIAGLLLGLAGLAVLTNPWAMDWTGSAMSGIALALIGTFAWALAAVLYKRRTWRSSFSQLLLVQLVTCLVVSIPIAIWLEWDKPVRLTPTLGLTLAWNMVGPTALGYWVWSNILSRVSAASATQVLLLSPIYGVLQSHVVLDEPLGPTLLASAALIVAGAALTFRRPRGQ